MTDILLEGPLDAGRRARAALGRFSSSQLPQYAIKEFKQGPLARFAWLHNKLLLTGSFKETLKAIQKLVPFRPYQTSTALEALQVAARTGATDIQGLEERYGASAKPDRCLCDQYRLALKARIKIAWKRRRRVTSEVTVPLACYEERDPVEENGLIVLEPKRRRPHPECAMGPSLRAEPRKLRALKAAVDWQPKNRENDRRAKALGDLIQGKRMSEEGCRCLGDAVFAFFAPADSVIMTTNRKDLEPLAKALGKAIDTP